MLQIKNTLGGGGANVTIDGVKVNAKGIALTSLGLQGISKTYLKKVLQKEQEIIQQLYLLLQYFKKE